MWRLFILLGGQRIINESGPQPFSLSDLKAVCELEAVKPDDYMWATDTLIALDRHYLTFVNKELSKKKREEQRKEKHAALKGRRRHRGR